MEKAASVLLTCLLAACAAEDAASPDSGDQAFENQIAQECTHAGLSTGQCASLMHYCFHDIEKCEIWGRPIRPPE